MTRVLLLIVLTGCAGTLPPEIAVRAATVEASGLRARADSVAALVAAERAQVAALAAQVRQAQAQASEAVQTAQQALERPAEVVTRVTERVAARVDVSGLLGQLEAHGARLEGLQGELDAARRFGSVAAGVVDSLRALAQAGQDEARGLRETLTEVQAVLAMARQGGGALGTVLALVVLWGRLAGLVRRIGGGGE